MTIYEIQKFYVIIFDDSNASNDQLLTLGMFVVVFFFFSQNVKLLHEYSMHYESTACQTLWKWSSEDMQIRLLTSLTRNCWREGG